MNKNITVIYGDGIGPEVTQQSIKVLEAVAQKFDHSFTFDRALLGGEAIDETGLALPPETIEKALASDAVLFGAVGHPRYDNDPGAKVRPEQGILGIRKALQLFANIRPTTTYAALHHLSPLKANRLEGVDFVMFRELTGGIYFGEKSLSNDGNQAGDTCTYTRSEIERVAHMALQFAQRPGRRQRLTLVDKANVLETSRLWRKVVQQMADQYANVEVNYMFVDNAAMQIILNPAQFDVILTENLFGDILSDEASVLGGSLGLAPSASVGAVSALFEPIHGSYPQAAGKDIANPIGSIMSAAMMLDHFGMSQEADLVREAVNWTLANGFVTKDIDPINFYFTSTVGDLVSEYVLGKVPQAVNRENIELRKSTII
jgi:3-isopropylmalate dehydrogenase